MERWQNKVAVVTGASSGIGHQVVNDLLHRGLKVVGLARRLEKLHNFQQQLPQELIKNCTVFQCDVGDVKNVNEVFDKIIKQLGGVDILINGAGIINCSSLLTSDVSTLQDIMQTNIMGVVHCTKRAVQSMRDRNSNGHILILNSIVGHRIPCFPPEFPPQVGMYVSSKYALTALTEMYRQELRHYKTKIKITSISPGVTDTDMVPNWLAEACDKNLLTVKEVSSAILYAISTSSNVQIHEMVVKPVAEVFS